MHAMIGNKSPIAVAVLFAVFTMTSGLSLAQAIDGLDFAKQAPPDRLSLTPPDELWAQVLDRLGYTEHEELGYRHEQMLGFPVHPFRLRVVENCFRDVRAVPN